MPFTITQNEMLKCKYNKICTRLICSKLQNSDERFKENLNKLRNIPCSQIRRLTQQRFILNLYTGLVQFLSKFQEDILDMDKLILKFIWEGKGIRIAKTVLIKKNKVG